MPHRRADLRPALALLGLLAAAVVGAEARAEPSTGAAVTTEAELPVGFVDAGAWIPDLAVDLRYLGKNNFVGRPIAGYEGLRVILTEPAARALRAVQAELRDFGLGLLVYDAYRPSRAVAEFVRWARDPGDTSTKARFFPDVAKRDLIREGYIAARSSHSRGSTVDVALVSRDKDKHWIPLDMGTGFDLFSPLSWPSSAGVPPPARAHRLLLRELMTKHGFDPYPREWWHFTLRDEPFPDTYFDFPVR